MSAPDVCVVVPTVREYECVRAYVANAREHGFDTDRLFVCLVTEDDCDVQGMRAMLDDLGVAGRVFDATARDDWFEEQGITEYRDLIPARSHAQTSFGLLSIWANDFTYGVFLDDDTRPHEDVDFFGRHLANLAYEGDLEERSSDESWVNVLADADADYYPRGYPYGAMGEAEERRTVEVSGVVASQGLWTNVPDLDAVRILGDGDLRGLAGTRTVRDDFPTDFTVAPGDFTTVCSMNLAFRREVVPAFYQFPMDDNPWGVGRFDDIWSGLLLKRACDALGTRLYTGRPLCRHDKAPRSTFDDLADEAAGLELNEHVWTVVRDADVGDVSRGAAGYAAVARAVADALVSGDFTDYRNGGFLTYAGEQLARWVDCVEALAPAERQSA